MMLMDGWMDGWMGHPKPKYRKCLAHSHVSAFSLAGPLFVSPPRPLPSPSFSSYRMVMHACVHGKCDATLVGDACLLQVMGSSPASE